jgi:hypothetical protein
MRPLIGVILVFCALCGPSAVHRGWLSPVAGGVASVLCGALAVILLLHPERSPGG